MKCGAPHRVRDRFDLRRNVQRRKTNQIGLWQRDIDGNLADEFVQKGLRSADALQGG